MLPHLPAESDARMGRGGRLCTQWCTDVPEAQLLIRDEREANMARVQGDVIDRDTDDVTATTDTTAAVSKRPGGSGPLERVTVNLIARASRALQQASELTGDTKTDTINRALQIYAYIEEITANGGAIYARESPDGELERLKMF